MDVVAPELEPEIEFVELVAPPEPELLELVVEPLQLPELELLVGEELFVVDDEELTEAEAAPLVDEPVLEPVLADEPVPVEEFVEGPVAEPDPEVEDAALPDEPVDEQDADGSEVDVDELVGVEPREVCILVVEEGARGARPTMNDPTAAIIITVITMVAPNEFDMPLRHPSRGSFMVFESPH